MEHQCLENLIIKYKMTTIKFLKNGIRYGRDYIPVHYSQPTYTPESKLPPKTITIYARDLLKPLPRELQPINETDGMTDYYEKDRARILPNSKFFKQVLKHIK